MICPKGVVSVERPAETPLGKLALDMYCTVSLRAFQFGVSSEKVRRITLKPNSEREVELITPGTLRVTVSSGMVTSRSISSAAWPGHWVLMLNWTLVNSGKAMISLLKAT